MVKKLIPVSILLSALIGIQSYADGATKSAKRCSAETSRLEEAVMNMPDSLFSPVEQEDLLDDEVYLKLAHEGWSREEILTIMKTAVANKKEAKRHVGYGRYAKQWLPTVGRMPGGDELYDVTDTTFTEAMRKSIARTVPEDLLNRYWEPLEYIPPKDRDAAERRLPGYFRQPKFFPSCGRICWMTLHPEDPDKLYVGPDGAGMFKTDDGGKHWECITDRIPVRAHRSCVNGYAIPVDPDDWDHVFGFMNNNVVYETCDGGQTWRQIQGATHKGFKRGDCFRDAEGNLKFIGCTVTSWESRLWISEDTCKTWTQVIVPDSLKDIHPSGGYRGLWFQYIVTDPSDRNKIYLPTSRSILYFDDGAKSEIVNGKRVYNIKKMHFKVYDEAGNRRYANHSADRGADVNNDAIFPCPANQVGDLVINPNKPTQWWFATGANACGMGDCSAVYRSEDGGKTWITLQDLAFRIGSGNVFGNELASVWLGGFGVNFADTTKLYGCSMSSAISTNGGRTFNNYHWAIALPSQQPDGRWVTVSASRHNADNHCIRSHKSGRVFRGSDGGMLMIDKDVNGGNWHQIGGDMGQMLFYHVAVNEFGDQCIAGNTQDIDGQTYRYGRWGSWRGYEGSESFVNPYTSAVYFAGMGSVGWDSSHMPVDSWFNAMTRADVVTGSWFLTRAGISGKSFLRCDDLGKTIVRLEPAIGEGVPWLGKFALCRDKGLSTVFCVGSSNTFYRSTDGGQTFAPILFNGTPAKFSGTVIASDPNNSDILYLGQSGKVMRYYVNESRYEQVGTGLPNIPCTQLLYHEGSGDLYFYHSGSAGIYLLECLDKEQGRYADSWRYWTKGYNSGKSTNVEINYTTQEMVICDYGRGVWCADLEHPSDRFFDNGFGLKEYSFKDGRRTIGIDTDWIIPLYYYFKWTVNGEEVDNPYQYMRRPLNPGDRVQLELTLRESPDVKTLSAEFIVPDVATAPDNEDNVSQGDASFDTDVAKVPGQALYSNGLGRIDLGYQDYFFNDFTIDFWLKPVSDGTILANRTRDGDPKGWEFMIESGALKFEYSPRNVVNFPRYETQFTQTTNVRGGAVQYGNWNHIAVTHERNGQVTLYLNGNRVASGARIIPEATLNSSMILSLFGDGIERRTMEGTIDELKIWTKALNQDQIRQEMYSTNADNKDGLVAYWPFNGGSLENDLETFTRRAPRSRVLAETTHNAMTVPICARYVSYESKGAGTHTFKSGETDILTIKAGEAATQAADNGKYGVFVYDASQWQNEEDNLDTDYFDYHPMGYLIHGFDGVTDADDATFEFHPVEGEFYPGRSYRLYTSDPNGDRQVWSKVGTATYDAETGTVRITDAKLSEIADMKLLLVTTRPSIELTIEGIGPDGVLSVYDETKTTFPMSANILSGLMEPAGEYQIEADGILKPSGLFFADGKASGELRLDLSKLGPLNSTVRTTLRDNTVRKDSAGKDYMSLIPLSLEVRNRIAPRSVGTGLRLINGYAGVGTTKNFKSLLNNNKMTVMGWVRLDSIKDFNQDVSLFTFRDNSGITGLRLRGGAFLFSQNARDIWCDNAFRVTQADLGRWHHYALVFGQNGIEFYLDGMPHRNTSYKANTTSGIGTLFLGKGSGLSTTFDNNDNFCGAFDQVAAWNRSLSQDEVIKYMYTGVPLDDEGLLAYLNMDYTDDNGTVRDIYSCDEIKAQAKGLAAFGEESPIPFDAKAMYQLADTESPISIQFPAGKARSGVITTFRGRPYCYLNHDFQNYVAINQEFYGLTYKEQLTNAKRPADTDSVTITYRHRTIMGDEHLAIAMRRTGTLEHLAGFIPAKSVEAGRATFTVPLNYLTEASEMMFFSYPLSPDDPAGERPALIQMAFSPSILSQLSTGGEDEVPTLILSEDQTTIPVIADIIGLSRNRDVPVSIIVNETNYASPSQETIDFSATENQFAINLDLDRLDPFGINPITLNLEGATANELKLNVCFEPYVLLTLVNGDNREIVTPGSSSRSNVKGRNNSRRKVAKASVPETNTFRTTSPVANLEVTAELLQGYLPQGEQVKLDVITELDNALTIGNGNLLKNDAVTMEGLAHHDSSEGSLHEGWNLIGNPYLTNINLTKSQNVDYDEEAVTKFFYQCDPVTGNYKVYDMTDYNASQQIHPFQSYFVQTMRKDADFTITPIAKEVEPTKRTRAYNVVEKQNLILSLSEGDTTYDEVTLSFDPDATHDFVTNEDAPKMWNLTGSSPELYAMTGDDKETAVTSTSEDVVDLGVKSATDSRLRLNLVSMAGLESKVITVHDNVTDTDWTPSEDEPYYEFTASGTDNHRFTVSLENDIETTVSGLRGNGYEVTVDHYTCFISGLQGDAIVRILTPNGIAVVSEHTSAPTFSVGLDNGVYIVTIHENSKDYTSKILVQ